MTALELSKSDGELGRASVRETGAASNYENFLARKLSAPQPSGFEPSEISETLFPFQRDMVRWALRRGRAAIFASTGLGKTRMQLEWARHVHAHTGRPVLILTPLAVAAQTKAEGCALAVEVSLCREPSDVAPGINVTNYERIHRFEASAFGAVVLDESSCIKHFNSKTLRMLLDAFAATPFRLCATATPAPNDFTELATHAEFLGVCSRSEMLAEFFCHDGGETQVWRLKGHAQQVFWRWVASWGALVRTPEDLGYPADAYRLPALKVEHHVLRVPDEEILATGQLFPSESQSLMERRASRKSSLGARVALCAEVVTRTHGPWVVWCDFNDESALLAQAIPGAIEVTGSNPIEVKEQRLEAFSNGSARVLVTKPSIAGFGLNWQHCSQMAFVGLTDSWESYFQAVRRCWRFGQTREVVVHVFASEMERAVLKNLERKSVDAERMGEALSRETVDMIRAAVGSQPRFHPRHHTKKIELPAWLETRGA